MIERIWPYLAVLCIGSAWGLTIPLTKVIVSDGYLFFGLIFWQQVICASVLGIVLLGAGADHLRHVTCPGAV